MALADTARLIASLELQDKFSGPAKRAEGSISGLDRKMSTLGASGQKLSAGLGRAFSTIAKIGVGVAAGGIAALTVNIKAGVESLNELEAQETQTAAVIKSTNGVAGQSAKDIRNLAEEYESLNAVIDDKVIQNAENMLLTFTNVRKDAFEPALEAALNLNQSLGGGEGGLQAIAIKVGKALNDPSKGLAALTKAGVLFSDEQKDRIKRLQEEGDLYGAQKIILKELETEFGGQFAAAGKTAEGSMARLGDSVEDLQQRLAGPLLPAIDRVRDKLADFLESKTAQDAATALGDAIAGVFTNRNIRKGIGFLEESIEKVTALLKGGGGDGGGLKTVAGNIGTIAESVKGLPWESIANAAKLLGTGSKALLDAFLGLPPWVQTAVLTGWGLNKLTGGALGGIVGELAKGLVKGVLGINAGVVNINAGTVNGGPGGVGGGRGGIAGGLAVAAGVGLSAVAVERLIDYGQDTAENTRTLNTQLESLPKRSASELDDSIARVDGAIVEANKSIVGGLLGLNDAITDKLESERQQLVNLREGVRYADQQNQRVGQAVADRVREVAERTRAGFTDNGAKIARVAGSVDSARGTIASGNATLQQIRDKKSSVQVNVEANTTVSLSASQVALQIQRVTSTVFNTNNRIDEALL